MSMRKGGSVIGSLSDRVEVAKHSLGSDTIAVAVVKATNNDVCAPKKKHVDSELFGFVLLSLKKKKKKKKKKIKTKKKKKKKGK